MLHQHKRLAACMFAGLLTLGLSGCANMTRHVEYTTEKPEQFPVVTATGYAPVANQLADTDVL